MAPDGPPPIIVISVMQCLASTGLRAPEAESSGDGENRQCQPGEEYSTEDGGGSGGARPAVHNIYRQPLQHKEDRKVSGKQHDQDFSGVEAEERGGHGEPGNGAKGERKREAFPAWKRFVWCQDAFFGEMPGKKGEKHSRETQPAGNGEPGFGEGEVEPPGKKQEQNDAGESGGENRPPGRAKVRRRESPIPHEERESGKKKEAGEVVALKDCQKAKGDAEFQDCGAKNGNHGYLQQRGNQAVFRKERKKQIPRANAAPGMTTVGVLGKLA